MLHAHHFRYYLATEARMTFGSVNSTTARVRRVEKATDTDVETLLDQAGVDPLVARIDAGDAAFASQNADALANCRAAVRRYHEFRQWRLAQQP